MPTGHIMLIENGEVIGIDLTDMFGIGNEPSRQKADKFMKYPLLARLYKIKIRIKIALKDFIKNHIIIKKKK